MRFLENEWFRLACQIAALIFAEFCIFDVLPGFYGPIEYLSALGEAHYKLAPWVSGFATSTGVIVALFNAQMKERSDDRRAIDSASRTAKATAEAACSMANAAHMNLVIVASVLQKADWAGHVDALTDVIVPSLNISRDAMRRFPMHSLPMRSLECWFRIELFQHHLSDELDRLRKCESRSHDDPQLLSQKLTVLKSVKTLESALRNLARELKVDIAWDFGSVPQFNVPESVSAEIKKITDVLKVDQP